MNEWEKLKRACCRFAALMRVLSVAVPTMDGTSPGCPGAWKPQLVVVREAKLGEVITLTAEDRPQLFRCWLVEAQRREFYMWVRDSCVLLCAPHPSELQAVVVKYCYGFNRLNDAEFAKAMLPKEQTDRERCLLLTVRPTVDRIDAAAVGNVAISAVVNDLMIRTFVAFESDEKASAALQLVRSSHAFFKERQKASLEKVLRDAVDLSE
jgi:hypothetical protein